MNRDTIIRLAREAGFADGVVEIVGLEGFSRFAALVAAHEREECAQVAEDATAAWTEHDHNDACMHIANAIRSRT